MGAGETLKVISGGQTGVDRAALDAAIRSGHAHGGWVPLGREAEDGVIAPRYIVQETPTTELAVRTEWNIRDSEATLILACGEMRGGTELTWRLANTLNKPVLVIDLDSSTLEDAFMRVSIWLSNVQPRILNVAGPRASEGNEVYQRAYSLLIVVLLQINWHSDGASEGKDEQYDVLRVRYEQALANFRHWDQIRWLVPAWFATVFAALIACADKLPRNLLIGFLSGMIAFAAICLWLMLNLMRYHNREMQKCRELVDQSSLAAFQRSVLMGDLPFQFEVRKGRIFKTASFSLMLLIFALMLLSSVWLIATLRTSSHGAGLSHVYFRSLRIP